jgi:hypothetical protein
MDVQSAPGAEGAPAEAPISVITTGTDENYNSVRAAAKALSAARWKKDKEPEAPADVSLKDLQQAVADPQESEAAPAAEDAPPPETEAQGETKSQAEPEETLPPIEPPRSWTKEQRERWQSLPRETQEYLAEREQERERELRRGQNEAAEQRKAIEAERSKVEQARQQYESALPLLFENLQSAMSGEFSDIKTMADVQKMATEDWPRYVRWDAQQKQVAAVQQEMRAAEERRNAEFTQQWNDFAKRQDELFLERVPEMADKDKAARLRDGAVEALRSVGFTDEELARSYNGKQGLSLRDHRVQLLVRDAHLWREAQAKAKTVEKKPVPPVQRPGVSQGKGAAREAEIANLNKQLEQARSPNSAIRAAARLVAMRRAGR